MIYEISLEEAYLCCVAQATDNNDLLLALPLHHEEAPAIVRSLVKNLPKYGYKLIKESDEG